MTIDLNNIGGKVMKGLNTVNTVDKLNQTLKLFWGGIACIFLGLLIFILSLVYGGQLHWGIFVLIGLGFVFLILAWVSWRMTKDYMNESFFSKLF